MSIQIVSPKNIVAPSGEYSVPKIRETRSGDKILVEAHWIDPRTGQFIRKGIVKVLDAESRKDITSTVRI